MRFAFMSSWSSAIRIGVLVVDETGFSRKGEHSIGVARQYSGTAGRTENSQIGVFLSYASRFGHAFVDRRLYLPQGWVNDRARRSKAGVPRDITFAAIACDLIASALDAGLPCVYVLGDTVYGSDRKLRRTLQGRGSHMFSRSAVMSS
jgi:SRSO17 transposase